MIAGTNMMNAQNPFELHKLEDDVDSVHLMPCKNGLFRKSVGKILPDQLIGQINNYQQNNYYGVDLWDVMDRVSDLLNIRQSKQDEIQYQNFIKSLKRFRTSGQNIHQLFDDASKISTQNIYHVVNENLYKNGLNEDFLNRCERLVFILYVYLFSSILIEGNNIKNEEEVRDDIDKLLNYLLNVYENFLFDESSNTHNRGHSISNSLYAQILTDENCDTVLIDSFAQIDRRFNNGYEVIDKIIKDRSFNKNNIGYDTSFRNDQHLKLYLSKLTFTKQEQLHTYPTLDNILKLRDIVVDLLQLKSMRCSFNAIEDSIVDQYHQKLLSLAYKK